MGDKADDPHDLAVAATQTDVSLERGVSEKLGVRLPPNRLYGRYEIAEVLGEGGMGVVYGAYDPVLDRRVALKVIGQSQRKLAAVATERLLREARALAKLAHPNVIAIHDVGSLGDEAFVAMELVQGQTLQAWLRRTPRGHDEVLDVFAQAGRGLAAAHAVGLVHRDFKPSNVMVGDDGRIRVVDFGLARLVELDEPNLANAPARDSANALSSPLTATGGMVGTPAYMAPEQFAAGEIDERADQFSFCVALYEALYGVSPFSGNTVAERTERINNGRVNPALPDKKLPVRIHDAIVRGLRASPADRHESMSALLAELQPAVPGNHRRRRWLATALALLALIGVAVLVVFVSTARREPPRAAPSQRPEPPARLRLQMVDSHSELMTRLTQHVATDAEAQRLGIRVSTNRWTTNEGNNVVERHLLGPDRESLQRYLTRVCRGTLAVEPGHEILLGRDGQLWRTHYLWTRVELDESLILSASVVRENPTGAPHVAVSFNERGKSVLAAVTGQNVGRRMATVVDGVVILAPVLSSPIHGGQVLLTVGPGTPDEQERAAQELVRNLSPSARAAGAP